MQTAFKSVFVLLFLSLPIQMAWADSFSAAIDSFKSAGESGAYFEKSYGYAVFPTIGKGGFVVGGAHGTGRVYANGEHVGNSSMTQVTVGFQLGGQAFSRLSSLKTSRP